MNAALPVTRADGSPLELHLSTHLPADLWVVELRAPGEHGTQPFRGAIPGETLTLPANAAATLHVPYSRDRAAAPDGPARLWIATLRLPCPLDAYLTEYGFPIRYRYVREGWPLSYYQTVYATEMGSAEMPSAGRAFTPELITRLVAQGVQIAPLLLHTGVASLEDHEPPYEEYYRVPPETAQLVNAARGEGRRIIAVGTTVVRALETVTGADSVTHPGEGWTDVVVTPQRGIRAVNAMLTGLHEPHATHLAMLEALAEADHPQQCGCARNEGSATMLEALAGPDHVRLAYTEALREGYLWHEFGDLHLLLP